MPFSEAAVNFTLAWFLTLGWKGGNQQACVCHTELESGETGGSTPRAQGHRLTKAHGMLILWDQLPCKASEIPNTSIAIFQLSLASPFLSVTEILSKMVEYILSAYLRAEGTNAGEEIRKETNIHWANVHFLF